MVCVLISCLVLSPLSLVSSSLPLCPSLPFCLPLYPQLISSSCLICCPFQFNIFHPCPLPNVHTCAYTRTHSCSYLLSSPSLLSARLSVSGSGSTIPSPPECVSLLHVKLSSWGHIDLLYPLPGINIFAPKSVIQKYCPARPFVSSISSHNQKCSLNVFIFL